MRGSGPAPGGNGGQRTASRWQPHGQGDEQPLVSKLVTAPFEYAVGEQVGKSPAAAAQIGPAEPDPPVGRLSGEVDHRQVPDTGCQIASIFDDLGATVSLFEAGPVLVPAADASVPAELGRAFRAQDMNVHTDTLVEALGPDSAAIRVDYRSGPAADRGPPDAHHPRRSRAR